MDISIRDITINNEHDYSRVYNLREEILRKPIGLSLKNEDLSADNDDSIVIAESADTIVGCIMIHPVRDPSMVKFRQMAVSNNMQNKGVGRMLIEGAERLSWLKGYNKIVLHARVTAEGFYEKLGYQKTSDVFTEVGIPHVVMEKNRP